MIHALKNYLDIILGFANFVIPNVIIVHIMKAIVLLVP
jgi:hypothetical protein